MKTVWGTVAALVLSAATAAAAPLKVGATAQFGMDDIDKIGFVNGLLNQKTGAQEMTSGGTVKKLAVKRLLICGFYSDVATNDPNAPVMAYAIITDGTARNAKVYAPLTPAQQEAKGCWPGERARENAEFRKLERALDTGRK